MAIATMFEGIEYRSRLEARWAAMFRQLGWEFEYEPFDGNGYIPDFLIQGDKPFLVEIKPATTRSEYNAPIKKVEKGLPDWEHGIVILGASPLPSFKVEYPMGWPISGLIRSSIHRDTWWDAATWVRCSYCNQWSLAANDFSFAVYRRFPCGEGDPDDSRVIEVSPQIIRELWAKATNEVKWRGTDVR